MIRSDNTFKKQLYEDISKEPVIIHFQCNKCNNMASLPEKLWWKRGSICSACWHRNYKVRED